MAGLISRIYDTQTVTPTSLCPRTSDGPSRALPKALTGSWRCTKAYLLLLRSRALKVDVGLGTRTEPGDSKDDRTALPQGSWRRLSSTTEVL